MSKESKPVRFSALPIGAVFVFAIELSPGYCGIDRGPWRKVSARKYVRNVPTPALANTIGTVRAEVREILPPTSAECLESLRILTEWAVGPNRDGNPYGIPEVRQALSILSRAHGGAGNWADGIERARAAAGLPAL